MTSKYSIQLIIQLSLLLSYIKSSNIAIKTINENMAYFYILTYIKGGSLKRDLSIFWFSGGTLINQ